MEEDIKHRLQDAIYPILCEHPEHNRRDETDLVLGLIVEAALVALQADPIYQPAEKGQLS